MEKRNILIVDDDESFVSSLKLGLRNYSDDFLFHLAENGVKAISILKAFDIDTVITDLKMPEMGGMELLSYIDKNFPTTKVIVMSAYGTQEIREQVKNLGSLTFLDKPLDIKQIVQAIDGGKDKDNKAMANNVAEKQKNENVNLQGEDMTLQEAMEFIRDNLEGVIMSGIIDAEQGIPLTVLNNDPNFDPSIPAGMYTNTFSSAVKAFEIVDWGIPSEILMPGEPNSVILIALKKGKYFMGIAFKSKTQLGMVRAILNRVKPEIEKIL
jgi:YesN/AraC family two-component response regulator